MDPVTKRSAKRILQLDSDEALANCFTPPISRQAAQQWAEDEPLPERRQWQLWSRWPRKFPKPR